MTPANNSLLHQIFGALCHFQIKKYQLSYPVTLSDLLQQYSKKASTTIRQIKML